MLSGTRGEGAESGNIILALLVLMVVVAFTGLAFATADHGLTRSADQRDLGRAGAAAELGVHEAFARIEQGETTTFTGTATVDGVVVDYRAVPSAGSWTVHSQATSDGTSRAWEATIGREALHPFTLFADTALTVELNPGTVQGRVGTNGTMTVTGPSPGTSQELYRPDGACTGCTAPVVRDGPRRLEPATAPAGASTACPADGRFEGAVDGGGGSVVLCADAGTGVTFAGDVTVTNPPLVVHVADGVGLTLGGARVNVGGSAADVHLLVAGSTGALDVDGAELAALLYAPSRTATADALTVTGSVTVGQLTMNRGGNLTISSDPSIAPLGSGDWRITDLRPASPT